MSEIKMRRWVRGWWADQMRTGDMPELPAEFEHDPKFHAAWTAESRRIADVLAPQDSQP